MKIRNRVFKSFTLLFSLILFPILSFSIFLSTVEICIASTTVLSDDFNDGSIDSSKWVHNGLSGGKLTENNGILYFATETYNDQQLRTKVNIGQYSDFTIQFQISPIDVSGDKNVGFWLGNLAEGDPGGGSHQGYLFTFDGKTR